MKKIWNWLKATFESRPVVDGNWAERHRRMKELLGSGETIR